MGNLWGKGKLGTGRNGVGEENNRCHVIPSSFWCSPRTNSIPWKAPDKSMRHTAQGPNKEISAAKSGLCGRSPMYFGFPGLAQIFVISAVPWSRNISTQPPGPKAGSRSLLSVPPLGYPPHQ